MVCPSCAMTLDDGVCSDCKGIWLTHEQVTAQVGPLESSGGTFSKRSCPVCLEQMQEPIIFGVPLDHCMKHGFWFDTAELDEVIKASTNDVWRLYGSGRPGVIDNLVEVIRAWRRK